MASILDDRRRVVLNRADVLEAYEQRDTAGDIVEICNDLTK
jgi:hypothetical protein